MIKTPVAPFLLLLLFIMVFETSLVQAATPGVTQGNFFVYDVYVLFSSSDPNAKITEDLLQFNTTEWYRVNITNTSGADISINTIWRFANGTEVEGEGSVNIESGIYNGGFWAIFAAGLNQNDRVHPEGFDQSTINETATKDYLGIPRETNHIAIQSQVFDPNDPSGNTDYTDDTDIYFDKQTGILVELKYVQEYSNPSQTVSTIWKIKDSNVLGVPESPSNPVPIWPLLIIATLSAIILIVALIYKKKRAPKK